MTSQTSLFNFGIYKNILKRFKWGSFLYFVILFLAVPFVLLVENAEVLTRRYIGGTSMGYLLIRGDYIIIPILLAIVVPTVVAVLCFGNVHSEKQGIFAHGLPVTRKATFISSLLGGFTLMAAPVILNGIILLIMSLTAYSELIFTWTVFYWIGTLLAIMFIMFSVATLSAFLTGHAAAHIGINIFIHLIPVVIALTIYLISDVFLYGFVESENFIATKMITYSPVVWIFSRTVNLTVVAGEITSKTLFSGMGIYAYLLGAVIVYVAAYFLYKNRKIEACGDVAAFSWFRPILKYSITAAVAVATFGVFVYTSLDAAALFILASALTLIAYFAVEMLMNKTFKVFRAYKGYIGFVVFCAVFISFFAYTGVFGYETRVPEISDIESASIFRLGADDAVYVSDSQDIEVVRDIHKGLIKEIPIIEKEGNFYNAIGVTYKLKDGKDISRRYFVSTSEFYDAFTRMYEISEFKAKENGIDNLNVENVNNMQLALSGSGYVRNIVVTEDAPKILSAVKKDIEELSFTEIEANHRMYFRVSVSIRALENKDFKFFKKTSGEREYDTEYYGVSVNSNFKNTIEVLKELGYYDRMLTPAANSMFISKIPAVVVGDAMTYKGDTGHVGEFLISKEDCAMLNVQDGKLVIEKMIDTPYAVTEERYDKYGGVIPEEMPQGNTYFVFISSDEGNLWVSTYLTAFNEAELPEYLKKYVAQ